MTEVISTIPPEAEAEADSFLQIPDDGEFSSILYNMFSNEHQHQPLGVTVQENVSSDKMDVKQVTCKCDYSAEKSKTVVPSTAEVSACLNNNNEGIARRVSDYSLVSDDDEMSHGKDFSSGEGATRREKTAADTSKITKKKQQPVSSFKKISTPPAPSAPASIVSPPVSKKRSASQAGLKSAVEGECHQKVQRRERNREHAKKSRSRKKNLTKQLEESLAILSAENKKLRQLVVSKFGEEETARKVKEGIVTPNDKLIAALQKRSNRVLSNSAISYLKCMGSDLTTMR